MNPKRHSHSHSCESVLILESQDEVIARKPETDEEGSDGYDKAALDDLAHNAGLHIFIQLVVQD